MTVPLEITKRITFDSGLETLTKIGATGWSVASDLLNGATNDGQSTANVAGWGGDADFSGTTGLATAEKFRQSAALTWEDWGVPPGATVLTLSAPNYWIINWTAPVTYTRKLRVVDSGGVSVHGATDLDSVAAADAAQTWVQKGNATKQSVISTRQVSTTVVKFEFEISASISPADISIDSVEILIGCTIPDSVSFPAAVSHMPMKARS